MFLMEKKWEKMSKKMKRIFSFRVIPEKRKILFKKILENMTKKTNNNIKKLKNLKILQPNIYHKKKSNPFQKKSFSKTQKYNIFQTFQP